MFCVAVCARRRNARRAALAPRRGAQPEHGRTPLPTDTDTKIAPALLALGGWAEAEWFGPSVLSDPEVIAFEFPKLPGARKQAFHVVYRTRSEPPSRKKGTKVAEEPRRPPRRTAGKLAALLEDAGAVRTVASSRDRFLFDTGAVLFFAEVPSAKLKQRSANKLRQELLAIGFSACVLIVQKDLTTLMLWPSSEAGIRAFVDAAMPEHRIHPAFGTDAPPSPKLLGTSARGGVAGKRDADREAKLLRQVADLQSKVDALSRARSAQGALEQLGLDDARLKSMLKLLHPDKHANSEAANEAAKWLNSMRDLLKGR